ncbi:MAG TPA: tetratricopeptide repeat protein [Pyrinomonadaceae bacterium]
MAFDKVKTLRAAERSLEMGKIPAAIKEYCKIVEGEPDDFTTLNILGDLHVRVGNHEAAISCFRRIADHYREQDFALKAIAMFRKIDRLRPSDVEIANSLADLYAQQDLVVEARAHYLVVANAHAKSGATQAGLDVLAKIANLDPQNTDVRIKLAEGYLKEGMRNEAAAAFTDAGQSLLARGALDESLEAFSRSLDIKPGDYVTLNGLLAAHSTRGTADEAAEIIARASGENPDDLKLLSMLAGAYVKAEDAAQANAATAALIEKDPSAYLRLVDVAHLYLGLDQVEAAVAAVARISEQMLAEHEEQQLLELLNEFLTCDADNVQALRLLVRAHWWQRDVDNLKASLERMAEAAEAAGVIDEERYALTQLTRLAPENTAHADRLQELGGATEEAAAELLLEFESTAAGQTETITEPVAHDFASESESSSPLNGESEFEWSSISEVTDPQDTSGTEMEIERGFTFEGVVSEELSGSLDESASETSNAEEDRRATLRKQELESVDFYIAQGYADIAVDTLDLLEHQFGKHPDIDLRRQQLETGGETAAIVMDAELPAEASAIEQTADSSAAIDHPQPALPVAQQPAANVQVIDAGLAEIFEEYRVSAESETNGNGDYETHYNLGLAYQEMDLFEEALEEFQMAISLVSPDDGSPRYLQCCNLLGHCFMQKGVPQLAVKWFNKGLNSPNTSDDERQALRFDLAAAYEQAGDLNQAKNLFTEIYGVNVSYRGVNERLKSLESRML